MKSQPRNHMSARVALSLTLLVGAGLAAFALACTGGGGGGGGVGGLAAVDAVGPEHMPNLDTTGTVSSWLVQPKTSVSAPTLVVDANLKGGRPKTGAIGIAFRIADGKATFNGNTLVQITEDPNIAAMYPFYAVGNVDGSVTNTTENLQWKRATAAQQSGSGIVNNATRPVGLPYAYWLTTTPAAEAYQFIWDSVADLGLTSRTNIYFAMVAVDETGWDKDTSLSVGGPFAVDNSGGLPPLTGPDAQFLNDWSVYTGPGALSDLIRIGFVARHPESKNITVAVQYSINGSDYQSCARSTTMIDPTLAATNGVPQNLVTNNNNGVVYYYWWDSRQDIPTGRREDNVTLRLTARDADVTGAPATSGVFSVDNSKVPISAPPGPPPGVNIVDIGDAALGQQSMYWGKTFSGNMTVNYTVFDPDANPQTNPNQAHTAFFQYSTDRGANWKTCTPATPATNPQTGVNASPTGAANSWTFWDSARDLNGPPQPNVLLRITVSDGNGQGTVQSLLFNVNNAAVPPPVNTNACGNAKTTMNTTLKMLDGTTTPAATKGGLVKGATTGTGPTVNPANGVDLEVLATDPESDPVTAVWEYTTDSGNTWNLCSQHGLSPESNVNITTSPAGWAHAWKWDALKDLGAAAVQNPGTNVYLRVWPADCSVTNPVIPTDQVGNADQGPAVVKDPNQPPTVVIVGMPDPTNTTRDPTEPMMGSFSPPFKVNSFPIPISYQITDPDGDACTIIVQYQFNNGGAWSPATMGGTCIEYTAAFTPASEGTGPFAGDGTTRHFVWDAGAQSDVSAWMAANPGAAFAAMVQITATDAKGAAGTPSTNPQAASFPDGVVISNVRPTLIITQPAKPLTYPGGGQWFSGDVTVTFDVSDADGDNVDVRFEYWDGAAFQQCTLKNPLPTGTITANAAAPNKPNIVAGLTTGTGYTVVWDTVADGITDLNLFLQGTPKDGGGDGAPYQAADGANPQGTPAAFRVNNNQTNPGGGGGGGTIPPGAPGGGPTKVPNPGNVALTSGFGAAQVGTAGAGAQLRGICAGDWNWDGKDDLAIADTASSNVIILISSGTGTFTLGTPQGVGYQPQSMTTSPQMVASGDFNNDQATDIVAVCASTGDATVLFSNGAGSWFVGGPYLVMSTTDYNSGNYTPWDVVVGDVKADGSAAGGDGALDIFTLNHTGTHNYIPCIAALVNKGGASLGLFNPVVNSDCQIAWPCSIGAGDWNGDGATDVTVGNLPSASTNYVSTANHVGGPAGTMSVVHRFDLSTIGGTGGGGGTFGFLSQINSCFANLLLCIGGGFGSSGVGVFDHTSGDWDGNGVVDWAVAVAPASPNGNDGAFLIGENGGAGIIKAWASAAGPGASRTPAVGANPFGIWSADLDKSGSKDIVVAAQQAAVFSVNTNSGGTFSPPAAWSGTKGGRDYASTITPWFMTMGDFNGDGKWDVAATEFVSGQGTNRYAVALGQ